MEERGRRQYRGAPWSGPVAWNEDGEEPADRSASMGLFELSGEGHKCRL